MKKLQPSLSLSLSGTTRGGAAVTKKRASSPFPQTKSKYKSGRVWFPNELSVLVLVGYYHTVDGMSE